MDLLRQYVGGPKNRYKDNKFNLDLTYITPRLIAMAFPASGLQKLYRNSIDQVKQFLIEHHGKDYMIVNLSGRQVDESVLRNVLTYDWEDHQAPPLEMLFNICETMSDFLLPSLNNVVAVHCNHGKGRTGTIVCCFLLYCSMFKDSDITLDFYAKKRFQTQEGYGVTQPCQIQYIKYFQKVMRNPKIRPRIVALTKIIFRGSTKFQTLYIKAKTFSGRNIVTTKKHQTNTAFQKSKNENNIKQLTLTLMQQIYFWGDAKLIIKTPAALGPTAVATYSFNTAFLEGNKHIIPVFELSPYSLRKSDNFGKNFEIQIQFASGCECPAQIDYHNKCNKCRDKLMQQQIKWKKIVTIVEKRHRIDQRERQSMLGYHLKSNMNHINDKIQNRPMQIQLQLKGEDKRDKNNNNNEDHQ